MTIDASVKAGLGTANSLVHGFVTLMLQHIHMTPPHFIGGRNALPRILNLEHGFRNPPISGERNAHRQDQGANK
jgi:hypothetical protein